MKCNAHSFHTPDLSALPVSLPIPVSQSENVDYRQNGKVNTHRHIETRTGDGNHDGCAVVLMLTHPDIYTNRIVVSVAFSFAHKTNETNCMLPSDMPAVFIVPIDEKKKHRSKKEQQHIKTTYQPTHTCGAVKIH